MELFDGLKNEVCETLPGTSGGIPFSLKRNFTPLEDIDAMLARQVSDRLNSFKIGVNSCFSEAVSMENKLSEIRMGFVIFISIWFGLLKVQ
jgi:hypothetical protein